ncbi:serpin family protein [Actinocatenispora sera]|uniref:Serpin n=1 Tax=Actinocatenispora sera TaxID=390989 RepID=A0A810L953_9ACTN|nr:serpin family protein [Actinocatenispora sera]BCJ32080.1 serpin [Actinocatenispora sera]
MYATRLLRCTLVVLLLGGTLAASGRQHTAAPLAIGTARPVAATGAPSAAALAGADTGFGLAVLAAQPAEGNVVLSPESLASGLGMAYQGARGPTAAAMARVLRLPATGEPLLAGLQRRTDALRSTPGLQVCDTVWLDRREQTRRDYLDRLATGYRAGVRRVPLRSDPAASATSINETVSAQTKGRIPAIVSADQLDGIGWVLTDAMALDARWQRPFRATDTHPAAFRTASGTVHADFLHGDGSYRYAAANGWQAVALPYRGGRLEMLALLPDGDQRVPTPATLTALTGGLHDTPLGLDLPKVNLSWSAGLSGTLSGLGMGVAFEPGADFTGISPDAGALSFVAHRATLSVAEKGTKAAAATAVGVTATSVQLPPRQVRFDHPYLMLIRDRHTGEPVLLARVTDPTRS